METSAKAATVVTQMLIRKPVGEVFNAMIDPAVTTKFWFTKSSGKLEVGKMVTWQWEMYGVSAPVQVKEIVANQKISIAWGEPATQVDFEFRALPSNVTYVTIKNYGFDKSGDELIETLKDSMGGFTLLLAGWKAYLEHNIQLNLTGDKYPKEVR